MIFFGINSTTNITTPSLAVVWLWIQRDGLIIIRASPTAFFYTNISAPSLAVVWLWIHRADLSYVPTNSVRLHFALVSLTIIPKQISHNKKIRLFRIGFFIYCYIMPIPGFIGICGSSFGIEATAASVVRIMDATDAAFCNADLVTLVGSTIPPATMSIYSPV